MAPRMPALASLLLLVLAAGPGPGLAAVEDAATLATTALSWIRLEPSKMLAAVEHLQGSLCRNHTKQLLDAYLAADQAEQAGNAWASRMVDAMAKSGQDLLRGSQYQLGSFDECLRMAAAPVPPQYCLAEVRLSVETPSSSSSSSSGTDNATSARPARPQAAPTSGRLLTSDDVKADAFQPLWPLRNKVGGRFWTPASASQWVRWGACLPAACSPQDARTLLAAAIHLDRANAGVVLDVSIPERSCQDNAVKPFQGPELVVIGVFIGFLSLLVIATVYDVFLSPESDLDTKGKRARGIAAVAAVEVDTPC
ncbi:uncharacterized protein LOC117651220 [Thrips palmi]|uniref:Uncharacterized protein LOC117651220 n=1 Tax=Thrips palmi TaxID=161013 RepID=A0A6P9A2A1_THRPL|nr:uncharacterized protein LOC117651220 [Thrips palmi]